MSQGKPRRSDAVISNYDALNATFYAEEPWRYFERRLLHLAEVAQDPAEAMANKRLSVGPLKIEVTTASDAETRYPTPAQSFIAIECEVLLHHSAETCLRLVHAHASDDPCPLLRMSELRNFGAFKAWVEQLTTSNEQLETVARSVFAGPLDGSSLTSMCHWIGLFARHFLDGAPYNAAKHGMTLAGGAEHRTLEVDGIELSNAKGASVNWLELWPRDNPDRRWTRASRLLSVEAFLAMIQATNLLMQALWAKGRHEHLPDDYPNVGILTMPGPRETFELLEVDSNVLSRWFEPLVANGEKRDIHIQVPMAEAARALANKSPPGDDATSQPEPRHHPGG
jgi:hypothetical protein